MREKIEKYNVKNESSVYKRHVVKLVKVKCKRV